ncbi:type IV toxin-antitoxin system AbiEi family antitoxin domain-containing protein [Chryseobacterium arthrosphaerae]|uniref:type IV toxin-antitoxin system AbiEi family antitoxin domain-containing protein n=1 Tax=Chryseobacterium arthrosphaerae TaxID=651561 RepID=UPI0028AF3057|nr:type IV toxin-antitoxin system AbiEi family antitoxin [Chryseobacterium arthrosphaerae]
MQREQKVREWILDLPKKGKITFSLDEVNTHFPQMTENNKRVSLWRMVEAGKIQSVWKGFYVIIPVEYELKGSVPPTVYIDQLMTYLNREYYIGLLNAAAFYGASHQQSQELTVITNKGNYRDKHKNGVKINFVGKKTIPQACIRQKTTKTGYINISNPELTAMDLIFYQHEIGGLSRAGTVLDELAEELDFTRVDNDFFSFFPSTTVQRLGYILDEILGYKEIAKTLYKKGLQYGLSFRKSLLKPKKDTDQAPYNKLWKLVINEEIEIDE